MELMTRFRTPVITAVGVLVAVIVVYAAWISPEGSKLSSLHGKETQLQSQQLQLQAEIATLKHDKAQMISNCQQLTKDLTEIPGHAQRGQLLAAGDPVSPLRRATPTHRASAWPTRLPGLVTAE